MLIWNEQLKKVTDIIKMLYITMKPPKAAKCDNLEWSADPFSDVTQSFLYKFIHCCLTISAASCYSNGSDRLHCFHNTKWSTTFASWRQHASPSNAWFFKSASQTTSYIGSAIFAVHPLTQCRKSYALLCFSLDCTPLEKHRFPCR